MKKGFTLIELLAVIVILAVIALISSPIIIGLIDDARKEAFKNSGYGIIKAGEIYYSQNLLNGANEEVTFTYTNGVESSSVSGKQLNYKGTKPQSGEIKINSEGKIAIALYNGQYCVEKDFDKSEITLSEKSLENCFIVIPPAAPQLTDAMIPVIHNGTNWVKADTNSEWYNYVEKEWANVVLVTEATRNTYRAASPGATINEADILAYLVWVPRYKYKLFNVGISGVAEQSIEVVFENKNTPKSNGSSKGEWLTHPAFTFGANEVNGIWVGKFETTGNATTPTVKPGSAPLRNQTISTQFTTAQKFNITTTYGITTDFDAHMMKNMEWGAVAYLSYSIYGKNADISRNSNSNYTGGGGSNLYVTNVDQSTTGNIYGIYDMNGGSWELVMGGMYNVDNTTIMLSSSGFVQATIDDASMLKYIDKYDYETSMNDYTGRHLGDATAETGWWYNSYGYFVNSNYPWFFRGGYWDEYENEDGMLTFMCSKGNGDYFGGSTSYYSFRLTVTSNV